jgi:hypothetical protein
MAAMRWRTILVMVLAATLLALAACAPSSPGDVGEGSTRLAFGLHEREDGTVVALGQLERIELEGGFYALTGAPGSGGTIAVIANPDSFETELRSLVGAAVLVHGTRSEEPSIRMAGPEIMIESIEEITDAPARQSSLSPGR